jgi:hypothetical protein
VRGHRSGEGRATTQGSCSRSRSKSAHSFAKGVSSKTQVHDTDCNNNSRSRGGFNTTILDNQTGHPPLVNQLSANWDQKNQLMQHLNELHLGMASKETLERSKAQYKE